MVRKFLEDVTQYMICKKEVAMISLSVAATKTHALRHSPKYLNWCEDARIQVAALNGIT